MSKNLYTEEEIESAKLSDEELEELILFLEYLDEIIEEYNKGV